MAVTTKDQKGSKPATTKTSPVIKSKPETVTKTNGAQVPTKPIPVPADLLDDLLQILNVSMERGGWKPEEYIGLGGVRERLISYLQKAYE